MWYDSKEGAALTDDQLFQLLTESRNQVILMEGPTGCGKTRMLKKIEEKAGEKAIVMPVDRFIQSLLRSSIGIEEVRPLEELLEGREVVCVEEVDMMVGKKAIQETAAVYLSKAAAQALVILTGIKLCERANTLIANLDAPVRKIEYR